ncbi:threonine-phosphate decarboxylase [Cohnella nanjingensis]|uniref:threonine-phosphate decarboxylase n=1 Tax=Cohnella nanjingensis TaxID=1387779 RepID=A0A7X0S0D1_9BACL|nr:threonine-phosphate decarboxylase CobD [Cohnella nanjingensis]MBB6675349.1 threonine-phosphate decarboxylase [Cohnella nanjingensis]
MLETYGHGGDWITAEEKYGRPADGWLDYSANMNAWGPPPSVEQAIVRGWRDIARYPDPAVRGLRKKLADVYGIPQESILVGNGAAELIDLAVRGLRPTEAWLAQPSFTEYGDALRKGGVPTRELPMRAENGFLLEEADLAGLPPLAAGGCIFLGHPNNPTGRLLPQAAIARLRAMSGTLLLDEAFMDFVPNEAEHSCLQEAAASRKLVVFRSMTKFYAIPGIRLGFLVSHPSVVASLAELQPPWSVNFLAQRIGEAVLDERAYAERTRDWLQSERPWLVSQLGQLGLGVVPGDVNYLLVSLPEASGLDVKRLQAQLARRGILIRDASLFAGLDERYFRIAVRLREENERLFRELADVLGQEGDSHD